MYNYFQLKSKIAIGVLIFSQFVIGSSWSSTGGDAEKLSEAKSDLAKLESFFERRYLTSEIIESKIDMLRKMQDRYCVKENMNDAKAYAMRVILEDEPIGKKYFKLMPLSLFASSHPSILVELKQLADKYPQLNKDYIKELNHFMILDIIDAPRDTPELKWAKSHEVTETCYLSMAGLGLIGESFHVEEAIEAGKKYFKNRIR